MMSIKNVVQIGAAGNVGKPVLDALLASGKFNITVLARRSSTTTFPSAVKVLPIDYSSRSALVDALKGQDAVVLTLGGGSEIYDVQNTVLDAAVEAGVPYIVPSSFGSDTINEAGKSYAFLSSKVIMNSEEYIRKVVKEGNIKDLTIFTGLFFDWGLTTTFLGDLRNRKVSVLKDTPQIIFTTLGTIADAVVSALYNPDRFACKPIRIHDFFVRHTDIIRVVEEELGEKMDITFEDSEEVLKESMTALEKGDDLAVYYGLLRVSSMGPKSACVWDPLTDENEALGLRKKDIREEVRKVLRELDLK